MRSEHFDSLRQMQIQPLSFLPRGSLPLRLTQHQFSPKENSRILRFVQLLKGKSQSAFAGNRGTSSQKHPPVFFCLPEVPIQVPAVTVSAQFFEFELTERPVATQKGRWKDILKSVSYSKNNEDL